MFAIAAVNGEGCRELVFTIQDWLDAHPRRDAAPVPSLQRRRLRERGESIASPASPDATTA